MAGSGTTPPFGHGPGPPVGDEVIAMRMSRLHRMVEQRRSQGGHRPPKRPRGPRFGLVRRIVRLIRGGGD